MSLVSKIAIRLAATLSSALDMASLESKNAYECDFSLADGTGANQANQIFSDTRTLAASGTENLDLAGVLTNAFGTILGFTKIKAIIIEAAAGNTNDVEVGGAGATAFISPFGANTDKIKVKPGGVFCIVAPNANGYAVTATTADILKITNGAGSTPVTYSIIIIGVV